MEMLNEYCIIESDKLEPENFQFFTNSFSKYYHVALTSKILWEKDIKLFFKNIREIISIQENIQKSIIKQWNRLIEENNLTYDNWKIYIEKEYDIILPDIKGVLNPFEFIEMISCMIFFKSKLINDINYVLQLIKPDIEINIFDKFCDVGFDIYFLSELCLMLEELYEIQIENSYLLLEDSIFVTSKKLLPLIFY